MELSEISLMECQVGRLLGKLERSTLGHSIGLGSENMGGLSDGRSSDGFSGGNGYSKLKGS